MPISKKNKSFRKWKHAFSKLTDKHQIPVEMAAGHKHRGANLYNRIECSKCKQMTLKCNENFVGDKYVCFHCQAENIKSNAEGNKENDY